MNPEKAHALRTHLTKLINIGDELRTNVARTKLPDLDGRRADQRQRDHFRLAGWIGEIRAVVANDFGGNPEFIKCLDNDGFADKASDGNRRAALSAALGMLETLKEFVFDDPHSTASEPLRTLIQQTLTENYFGRREWKILISGFGAVLALLFGGTVYLDFKSTGVARQADTARMEIESARDKVIVARNVLHPDIWTQGRG